MGSVFSPTSDDELVDIVRRAIADRTTIAINGAGTKRGWGRPVAANSELSVSGLGGIGLYEPEELVLSARAGTSMAEIERRLAQQGQQLAFEPPDLGPLFGRPAGGGTLGGAIGCNLAGPRRIAAGAARDHVLGFSGINGLGESFKAGGRVVKNVTGFDLSKLVTGSFGTLAILTDISLKVLPRPEDSNTIVVFGLEAQAAVDAMGDALRSPHEVSGAAFLPGKVASRSALGQFGSARSVLAVRIEGAAPSVAARRAALIDLVRRHGETAELGARESETLWREIRDVAPFLGVDTRAIWNVSVPPAFGAQIVGEVASPDDDYLFDWGGGRIWLATGRPAGDAAARIRNAISVCGGHATLIRAQESERHAVPVFQPVSAVEANLVRRLKQNFDPHGIFNPGRMYEGI